MCPVIMARKELITEGYLRVAQGPRHKVCRSRGEREMINCRCQEVQIRNYIADLSLSLSLYNQPNATDYMGIYREFIGNLSCRLFYFINSLLSHFNCLSFCVFPAFSFRVFCRARLARLRAVSPTLSLSPSLSLCLCVFLMHVT